MGATRQLRAEADDRRIFVQHLRVSPQSSALVAVAEIGREITLCVYIDMYTYIRIYHGGSLPGCLTEVSDNMLTLLATSS